MDVWSSIAEEKIREAMARGEFDNLPGTGKPLPPDDMAGVPEDLRMAYKILKNAGVLPEEMQLHKEIVTLEALLRECLDEGKEGVKRELNEKKLRFRLLMEQRGMHMTSAFVDYEDTIRGKLE